MSDPCKNLGWCVWGIIAVVSIVSFRFEREIRENSLIQLAVVGVPVVFLLITSLLMKRKIVDQKLSILEIRLRLLVHPGALLTVALFLVILVLGDQL